MSCVICTEIIEEKDKVALSCGHMFHTDCIIIMIKKRYRSCPLCTTKIIWTVPQFTRHKNLNIM